MADDHPARPLRAGQADAQAFRQIVDAHANTLFRVCVRITGDRALAEDALQEAFLNAWRHLGDFDGRAALTTWLHRIAVNAALEQLRRRGRHETRSGGIDDEADTLDAGADAAPEPDRHASSEQLRESIESVLARMSVIERTAFVLRHHEGQSLEHVASVLALNVNACKQAVFRAVRKLRAALEPTG